MTEGKIRYFTQHWNGKTSLFWFHKTEEDAHAKAKEVSSKKGAAVGNYGKTVQKDRAYSLEKKRSIVGPTMIYEGRYSRGENIPYDREFKTPIMF